jgi:23S rRNA (cytosine1962-C5)-methyltransferase
VAKVVLKKGRALPFFARHPWVFSGAIETVVGAAGDGDEVTVVAHDGTFVGYGLFNSHSQIRVRLYSWDADQRLTPAFWESKLDSAFLLRAGKEVCRLVASEGDGLSGLTVDRYGPHLVVAFTALGIARQKDVIVPFLARRFRPESISLRTEKDIHKLERLAIEDQCLLGELPNAPIEIVDQGVRMAVDLRTGQKTGFYLDQTENRVAAARYAKGRTVLDAFCYSGGFGLHAARAGATHVKGVDSSAPALALARQYQARNGFGNMEFVQGDVFQVLETELGAGRRYGMVILDPPKFARSKAGVRDALSGYQRLLHLALGLLEPSGILVFCCCSGRITTDDLEAILGDVSHKRRCDIQILERRGAAPDHPVLASCPESNYLKCFICRVL